MVVFLARLRVTNPTIRLAISVCPSIINVLVVSRAPLCEQHNYQNYCTDIPMCDVNKLK